MIEKSPGVIGLKELQGFMFILSPGGGVGCSMVGIGWVGGGDDFHHQFLNSRKEVPSQIFRYNSHTHCTHLTLT